MPTAPTKPAAEKAKSKRKPADGSGAGELFLIDGNSLAYRAFFALPETIATSDGRPTNAIYGFASMLVKVLTDCKPGAVVVAWDAGMSGRELEFEAYKVQRKPRPDLLAEQWPHFMPLVEAFGYTNVKVAGYEADDVIASLVRQARERGLPAMVVTGDRDAFQLAGDGVRIMTTSRGVTDTRVYDREGVIERYGIPPELVPDFIGLKGDTSDNIPGVPGIGDKTAAELLQRFGSLEAVLASVDEISGAKRKANLTEHADDARVSKKLATMIYDVETGIDLGECFGVEPDRSRLREVFREFELRDPLRRLEEELGTEAAPPRPAAGLSAQLVMGTLSDFDMGPVSIAVEDDRWAAYDGERLIAGEALDLSELTQPLIAHDAKALLAGSPESTIEHDTMIAAYLIDPALRKYDLDELAADEGLTADIEGVEGAALLAFELAKRQRPRIEELGLSELFRDVELPLVEVLAAMEREGIGLDVARLGEIAEGMAGRIEALQAEIWALAGREFTIGSPQQLAEVLFDELGLSRKRRGKTGFSTDARVLAAIRDEHEIVGKVEQWRELTKLKNTYLDSLPGLVDPGTGRIHTTFNQAGAATGRLSSTNPNLQNIPIRSEVGRPVRGCFVAAPGNRLLSADYNQIELRVLAQVADEGVLKEIFRRGEDVHAATAAEILGASSKKVGPAERSKAKMVNYGIAYGLSAFGLADRLQIPQAEAAAYIDRYFERFPAIKDFIAAAITAGLNDGYVTTMMGRRRAIPELKANQRQTRQLGERLAVNTVIQGSAADIIKVAMVRCRNALAEAGLATRLILQIHDELLFEGPAAEMDAATATVRAEMCGAVELDPPLEVAIGVGEDWLAVK